MSTKLHGRRRAGLWLLVLGLLSATTFWSLSPWGQSWEEGLGLDLLFYLRGERPPPAALAIIAINEHTAATLGLPEPQVDWPRSVYAQLLDTLNELQVKLVVFDVFFKQRGDPEADRQFAAALRRADNVILFAFAGREVHEFGDQQLLVDSIAEPQAPLQQAALATAPFMLPKVASKVTRFWTRWAGHPPRWTLPAAALLAQSSNRAEHEAWLTALGSTQVYNYYGPPRHITTLGLEDVLNKPLQYSHLLTNSVVFVGYSALHQPGQKDGFYTPFTAASGLDVSGVELAATAYANLLERSAIRYHPGIGAGLLLLYGSLILLAGLRLPPGYGLGLILLLASAYALVAHYIFSNHYYWLPLITPLLLLTPLVLVVVGWHRVRVVAAQKQRLEFAFGRYLPAAELRRLASRPERFAERETLFGVCLVTDAEGYTRVAEELGPERLSDLMAQYYAAVITPIRAQGGIISDVAGDGVIAIWTDVTAAEVWPTIAPVLQALQASIAEFNRHNPASQLLTRIGVHAGEVVLGHFGASDHFEYRAIGDLVNTASRIENASKSLGVRVLLSDVCVTAGAAGCRCLGDFLLAGKQQPIRLYSPFVEPWNAQRETRFSQALTQLQAGQSEDASAILSALQRETDDPVCAFYLRYGEAEGWNFNPQADAQFIIKLGKN